MMVEKRRIFSGPHPTMTPRASPALWACEIRHDVSCKGPPPSLDSPLSYGRISRKLLARRALVAGGRIRAGPGTVAGSHPRTLRRRRRRYPPPASRAAGGGPPEDRG